MSVIALPSFITEPERLTLVAWCEDHRHLSGPAQADALRYIFCSNKVDAQGGFPELAHVIQQRIRNRFPCLQRPLSRFLDGLAVGVLLPGGQFAPHTDEKFREGELVCVGVNVLLSAADSGGLLTVGGVPYAQNARDALAYLLSEQEHGVSQVGGNNPRIVWSFRFMADPVDWQSQT